MKRKSYRLDRLDHHLTPDQIAGIDNGAEQGRNLEIIATNAVASNVNTALYSRHTYIQGPPGTTKTYSVDKAIQASGVTVIKFHGHNSMNAFALTMARELMLNPKGMKVVWVDDCDSFFTDKKLLNVMKNILDPQIEILSHGVNMNQQIQAYENSGDTAFAAYLQGLQGNGVGIKVPMSTFRFVITSNHQLASAIQSQKTPSKIHSHAVRSRVNYIPLDLHGLNEEWGRLASIVLTATIFDNVNFKLSDDQLRFVLDMFYDNWYSMTENSVRTFLKVAADLVNNPTLVVSAFKQMYISPGNVFVHPGRKAPGKRKVIKKVNKSKVPA